MAQLVVKLSRGLSEEILRTDRAAKTMIEEYLSARGLKLLSGGGTVGESKQYFFIDGIASPEIDKIREDLQRQHGVEAAYEKPPDALP